MKREDEDLLRADDYEYEKGLIDNLLVTDEQRREEENQRIKQAENERKVYEKQLQKDKVELAKLRSGVIDESESIKEDHDEVIKLKGLAYWKNFLYHNKLMIIVLTISIVFVGYLIYDLVSTEKYDLKILVFPDNGIAFRTDEMTTYFENFAPDLNDDGEAVVKAFCIPLNENITDPNLIMSNNAKKMAEFQSGEAVLVIADEQSTKNFPADELLVDMTTLYPDNENVTKYGYLLTGEKLKDVFKWQQLPQDMYIGLRKPRKTVSNSEEEMQKNYDIAKEFLDKLIEDLEK